MLWNNTQQHKQSGGFRSLFPPLTWKVHISTRTQLLHCSDLNMPKGGVIGEGGVVLFVLNGRKSLRMFFVLLVTIGKGERERERESNIERQRKAKFCPFCPPLLLAPSCLGEASKHALKLTKAHTHSQLLLPDFSFSNRFPVVCRSGCAAVCWEDGMHRSDVWRCWTETPVLSMPGVPPKLLTSCFLFNHLHCIFFFFQFVFFFFTFFHFPYNLLSLVIQSVTLVSLILPFSLTLFYLFDYCSHFTLFLFSFCHIGCVPTILAGPR